MNEFSCPKNIIQTQDIKWVVNTFKLCNFSLVLGILVSFKKDGKLRLGGETLDADSIMGNANFFKTVEGFMESLPQSTYQLSIMMRTPWHEISKNKSQIKFIKLHNCLKTLLNS